MMLKRMKLENIRSYVEESIDFDSGILLFQGDIGSGKSSILLGLEFVLFGAINQGFYDKITRHNAERAAVELEFNVDGKDYTAYRSIKRTSNGMKPHRSHLVYDGTTTELSPEEMRERILELLKLREKSRGKVETFHMSIFTPQEQMNAILSMRDEERLQAVRKIFNVEEYKRAIDNISVIKRGMETEITRLETRAERIGEDQARLEEKKKELEENGEQLEKVKTILDERKKELEKSSVEMEKMGKLKDERQKAISSRERHKSLAGSLKENIVDIEKELKEIKEGESELDSIKKYYNEFEEVRKEVKKVRKEIEERTTLESKLERLGVEYDNLTVRLANLKEQVKRLEELKKEIEELKEETKDMDKLVKNKDKLQAEITELKGDIKAAKKDLAVVEDEIREMSSLEGEGECPKCKQSLSQEHIESMLKELRKSKGETEERLSDYNNALDKLTKELRTVRKEIEEKEGLERKLGYRVKDVKRLEKETAKIQDTEKSVDELEKDMKELKTSMDKFEHTKEDLKELESLRKELRKYRDKKIQLEEKIGQKDNLLQKKKDKEERLRETEEMLKKIQVKLKELEEEFSEEEYQKLKKEHEVLIRETSTLKEKLNSIKKTIERLENDIYTLKNKLEEMKKSKKRANELGYLKTWLNNDFKECIRAIEEHRMAQLNVDFESYFRAWFDEILDDPDINASLDEDFAPVITVHNNVTSVDDISGGERTSVALAYRLAFNTMIKKELGLHSNLLVLDEPTTGFSREQLTRLKDVMEKVTADQIVIVSHENEIVNLADVEYLVQKSDGESKVRQII